MADGQEIDRHLVCFQDDRRATNAELADPAGAGSTAHHDPCGIAPRFEFRERADDERKLLRETLNRPLHNAGGLGVALCEQRIELLPADLLARLVPERIVAGFAQRLAPALEDRAERALVGAVAEQTFVVLQFDIVAFDLDFGRAGGAMRGNAWQGRGLIGHRSFPRRPMTTAKRLKGFAASVSAGRSGRRSDARCRLPAASAFPTLRASGTGRATSA